MWTLRNKKKGFCLSYVCDTFVHVTWKQHLKVRVLASAAVRAKASEEHQLVPRNARALQVLHSK